MLTDFIKSRINQGINSCKTPMRCSAVEVNKDHVVVTINGGNNGYSDFNQYLTDIKTIISYFDKVWLIDWINDCLDDVWVLRIGIGI